MQELLSQFGYDPTKIDARIWAVVGCVWLMVVGCGVGSVYSQRMRFSNREQWLWISLIVGVPVLGLLAYLPFSYKREGMTILRKPKESKKRLGSKSRSQGLLEG